MGCCAVGTCTDQACPMCVLLPQRFPPIEACPKFVKVERNEEVTRVRCRYVKGHPRACQPVEKTKAEPADTRDGAPLLAAERKRPTVRRSKRAGPHYVPPARRV